MYCHYFVFSQYKSDRVRFLCRSSRRYTYKYQITIVLIYTYVCTSRAPFYHAAHVLGRSDHMVRYINVPCLHNDSIGLLTEMEAAGASGLGENIERSASLGFSKFCMGSDS